MPPRDERLSSAVKNRNLILARNQLIKSFAIIDNHIVKVGDVTISVTCGLGEGCLRGSDVLIEGRVESAACLLDRWDSWKGCQQKIESILNAFLFLLEQVRKGVVVR